MASLCHLWFTTTNLSYRFPIFETSATALCGTTGTYKLFKALPLWLATVRCKPLPLCSSALRHVLRRTFYLQHGQLIEKSWQLLTMKYCSVPLRAYLRTSTGQRVGPASGPLRVHGPTRPTGPTGPRAGPTGLQARALGLRARLRTYGPGPWRLRASTGPRAYGLPGRAYGPPGPGQGQPRGQWPSSNTTTPREKKQSIKLTITIINWLIIID